MGRGSNQAEELFYGEDMTASSEDPFDARSADWALANKLFTALWNVPRNSLTYERLPKESDVGYPLISEWSSLCLWEGYDDPVEWENYSADVALMAEDSKPIFKACLYGGEDLELLDVLYEGQSLEEAEKAVKDRLLGVRDNISGQARKAMKEVMSRVESQDSAA